MGGYHGPEAKRIERQRAIAAGLCSSCYRRRPRGSYRVCAACRSIIRERTRAYRAGKVHPEPRQYVGESPKWAELDNAPACERCGLHGEHDCLPEHADGFANKGPGPSYPAPGGCGFTVEERRRMRTPGRYR